MNLLTIVGRLGRDAELRNTSNGTAVANLAVAYNYGRKDADGKRPTQWVDASLWGERAAALEQYLVKGQQVALALRDVHIRTYDKNDGSQGFSLCGDVAELSLVGDAPKQQDDRQARQPVRGNGNGGGQRAAAPARQPARQAAPARGGSSGFEDMDDDIPF